MALHPVTFWKTVPSPCSPAVFFFIIACLRFGTSKARLKHPQIQVIMLAGDSHVLSHTSAPCRGWIGSFMGPGI